MNIFFRICVVACIGLIMFSLLLAYFASTGSYGIISGGGKQIGETGEVLEETTALETGNMNYLWGIVIGGIAAGLVVGYITHSIVPTGVFIFGSVFWASFINTHTILGYGGYVPIDFLNIFTVGMVFIFIAACIGMLTGS